MTVQKTIVMMTNTGNEYDVVGDAYRADGYWGFSDGMHTVSVTYQNFFGAFRLQATLSTKPQDGDWFDIDINPRDHRKPWVEFTGESGIKAYTFIGNFVFLRAILDRSCVAGIEPNPHGKAHLEQGQIDRVLLVM
jgi:hypothetical protein